MFLTDPLTSVRVALALERRNPCPQHANLLFLLLQLNTLLLDLLVCNTLSRKKVNKALEEKRGTRKTDEVLQDIAMLVSGHEVTR